MWSTIIFLGLFLNARSLAHELVSRLPPPHHWRELASSPDGVCSDFDKFCYFRPNITLCFVVDLSLICVCRMLSHSPQSDRPEDLPYGWEMAVAVPSKRRYFIEYMSNLLMSCLFSLAMLTAEQHTSIHEFLG